ncbi:putative oxidoreductase [Rhodococcoides trifolii]|uniref:Oxidoreductase n=1 Tax=Rhodococcoides trifolii TaxID=908250 RepID=A0A917CL51_9NOCA|nr:PDR/VanB family oxidoreductase [Rhodococcus trifolii]GGF92227.1 putative oxidoreductase [Rhodococcus trifolii]
MIDGPLDLRGRPRPDRILSAIGLVVNNYLGAVSRFAYDESVAGTDRSAALELAVDSIRPGTADGEVAVIELVDPSGDELPAWKPGSHIDIHLGGGVRRQYSLCGDPADRGRYRVGVRRIPSGIGSGFMHALLAGSTVTVRGPRNAFPFAAEPSVLFLAGGIGITPILPMVRAARDRGLDWRFVYAGRSRESMPFLDEIESWESDRVRIHTDVDNGFPTTDDLLGDAPDGGAVYCCGPPPMLAAVRSGFKQCPAIALHFERFGPAPIVDGRAFQVQLVSSGQILDVPADRSALSVIKEQEPNIGYSCQQGFCGTCKVRVLSGIPDHREKRLTDDERADHMLICVSRADRTRLVLDL